MGKSAHTDFRFMAMRLNLCNKSVASVYFSNGSAVDIAKIQGGPAYRQMMRATEVLFDGHATAYRTLFNDTLEAGIGVIQQSLRDFLPPWLGGRNAHSQPLPQMLKALKTATESYLEASISAAEVTVPFPVSDSYLDSLRSACSSLSLHMPLSAQPPAGILAARANGIAGKCDTASASEVSEQSQSQSQADDPAQLILTVGYTRAALTAILVVEECGVFEYRRVLHDTHLGVDGLSGGSDSSYDDLARALRNVISLPLEDGNGAELKRINNLVLLGESAGDHRLHDVLKEVLGEQFGRLAATVSDGHMGITGPLYAASRGVAQDCWDRIVHRQAREQIL
jgi:hypothetical protein